MEDTSDQALRRLVDAIVADDGELFAEQLDQSKALAQASFAQGATRQEHGSITHFLEEIGYRLYAGDTALHVAAAAYRCKMVEQLIQAGAQIRAKNRRGTEALHAAAVGNPAAPGWDPIAQSATIACLIQAGADPNAQNRDGATPLHRAVRTRCAGAVRALLAHGADPKIRNKSGTTAMELALQSTGRSGAGSVEAKAQQKEILLVFQGRREST